MPAADLLGYADKLSVDPGETIAFMVSTTRPRYDAEIVRLTGGPRQAGDLGSAWPPLASGSHPGREQLIPIGSCVVVPDQDALHIDGDLTIAASVYATLPARGNAQGIVAKGLSDDDAGFALLLDGDGHLALHLGADSETPIRVTSPTPIPDKRWVFLVASYGGGLARIDWQERPESWLPGASGTAELACDGAKIDARGASLLIGALELQPDERGMPHAAGCYNGKVSGPRLWNRLLGPEEIAVLAADEDAASLGEGLIGAWDFAAEMAATTIRDRSPSGAHGQTVNMPTRGVTGPRWEGSDDSFLTRPEQYDAIAFHEDDLDDCRWEADFAFTVPAGTPSGVYAARLTAEERREEIPFYVRPARGAPPAPILYLAPTNTYLAYANFRMNIALATMPGPDPADPAHFTASDHLLIARPDLGASVYDRHLDGSGVCYSSRLRPIVTMRSDALEYLTAAPRHFSADLYLIEWLDRLDVPYDVATDEDLHRDGRDLLDRYRVVLTGSHPEYWTAPMLDALEAYLADGGRLMYLGGNGFYWVTGMDTARPHLVEVRRGLNGTRSWTSEAGETRLSLTGEIGGLWRNRGRFPNQLVGVGFAAQGWDAGGSYRRLPDSLDPRAAFIFAGVGDDERIGDFGIVGNGGAGDEVDRYDLDLGTPPRTLRLATSEGEHSDAYQLVIEDTESSQPYWGGSTCPLVRADLVYLETEGEGAVFSVGSINWIASLPHNGFANNVARITENVLRRFAGLEPGDG